MAAAGARIGQRLANQKIDDEADANIAGRENQHQQSPQRRVHAAAFRVAIDVAEHQQETGEQKSDAGDDADYGYRRRSNVVAQIGGSRVRRDVNHDHADGDSHYIQNDAENLQPARYDPEFVAKAERFFLAAQTDHPHAFVP